MNIPWSPRMHGVALAIALLLTPTAVAKPIDEDMRPSVAKAFAAEREKQQPKQDLRSPDTRDAATTPMPLTRAWPAYPTPRKALPGPPTWPLNPQPINPTAPAAGAADDGVDWATIGIGVGLSLLAFGAVAGVAHRVRVRHRPRVAT